MQSRTFSEDDNLIRKYTEKYMVVPVNKLLINDNYSKNELDSVKCNNISSFFLKQKYNLAFMKGLFNNQT